MKKRFTTLLYCMLGMALAHTAQAQETWSLQRCIGHALEQNLTIRQAQANFKIAELSEKQAKTSRLPGVNLNTNLGEQLGTTVDPTTSVFAFQNITTSSVNLNANMPLYTGGQIRYSIQQAKVDARAAEADLQQTTNNLALQVASAYLSVLLNQEQLENAQNQVNLSRKQLANTNKQIEAGNLPLVDRYNIEAQIAREEQSAITAENSVETALLNLKQLMQLEPDFPLQLERPDISPEDVENLTALTLPAVFEKAKNTQPSILAADLRVKSSELGVKVAKAGYQPSLSFFGNMSAFYSSRNKSFLPSSDPPTVGPATPVVVGGFPTTLSFLSPAGTYENKGYFDQLDETFGQSLGVSLSVPIYQNGRVKLAVERARLSVLNAQIQQNQAQQQLKNDIQSALANARNAKKQMLAAQKTYDAAQLAYINMEKRHAIGAVNTMELNLSKNNMDTAANNLTVARYDYLFRLKILEFYLGKPILID